VSLGVVPQILATYSLMVVYFSWCCVQLDKYLEHTNTRMNVINMSFNQIFVIHSLLITHLDAVVCALSLSLSLSRSL
jgi:hypothetical protein